MKTKSECAAVRLEKSRLLAALAVLVVAFVVLAAVPAVDTDGNTDSTSASAELVQSGDGKYATIADALSESQTDLKLIGDLTENVEISGDEAIFLDLNGFKLTNESADTIYVKIGATLTIKDSSADKTGTVDNISHGKAAIFNNGTVTLEGGKYLRSAENGISSADNGGNSYYNILNHGVMTVKAGVTVEQSGHYSSLFVNGYFNYTSNDERSGHVDGTNLNNPELIINGGTFTGGLNTIKSDDGSKTTINGGTFSNVTQAAVLNANEVTINGGTFSSNGNVILTGKCSNTEYNAGTLTINGGTFSPGAGFYIVSPMIWNKNVDAGTVIVTEGVIKEKPVMGIYQKTATYSGSVEIGTNKVEFKNITADGPITFTQGSVVISGTMDASTASAEIAAASGSVVVLKNLTITDGKLNLKDVTIGGKVTVKESATVNAASNVEISSTGSLIVAGTVTGTGLTNNGTISIISPAASIPLAIDGSGSIDASGAQEEGTLSGSYNTTTTITMNTIITATGDITFVDGTTFTFKGTFIIPEGVTVTIEDGARLIAADATGKIINNGTIVVESRVADGGLYLTDTAIIENNGTIDLVYEGASDQWSAFLKHGRFVNNGTLTVGEGSNLILGETDKNFEFENNGTVVVNGEINYRATDVTILNSGLFQMNGKTYTDFTIYQMSTDASVVFDGFTNMYSTSNPVTITVSDEKFKFDDGKYDHTRSTVAITAGYKDVVSGMNISLVAEKKNENGTFLPQFLISGNVSVNTEEENGTASAIITAGGDNIVSDSLTIGENIVLTIDGTLDVSGQISAVKNSSIGFADTNAVLTVTGKVSVVSASGLTGGKVNASAYVIPQTTTSDKTYVYTTLVIAVADGADKIEILGDNEVSENVAIPSGTTITVTGKIKMTDDGNISFSEGSSLKNNGTIDVDGVLFIADKKNSIKTVGDINSQVIIEGDKDRTYCNVIYALNNAAPGSIVKLSDDNTSISIDESMTIPANVTLDTNGVNVNIAEKVVLTVDGTLLITNPSVIALNGTDGDKAKIVLNGTISSPDNAIPDDLGTAGAFYSITVKATTTYYVKPVADAAAIIATVDDLTLTLKGGDIVIGDVSFTGTMDASASVVVMTKLTATSIILDLASVSFSGEQAFAGAIANGVGTINIAGKAADGFTVASSTSKDVKTLTVNGQFNDSGDGDKFAVFGDVTIKATNIDKLTVDGNAKIAKGTTGTTIVRTLVINGVVEVKNDAKLNVTGSIEVLGTLTAAAMTDSAAAGSIITVDAFVGIMKQDSIRTWTTATSASVSGKFTVTGYAIVAEGSEVPESITSSETVDTTAYIVDGKAYVTAYAFTDTPIGIIKASVSDALWTGWYSGTKTTVDVSSQNIGSTGNETVYAMINYNIYDVVLKADAGIENVAIDGNLMDYDALSGTYSLEGLKSGTHTVTYSLKNGYSGNATLAVNGEKQSSLSFTVSGAPAQGDDAYVLQLSGICASGYTPVTPVTPTEDKDDDGLSLTDILLIVLVVLIVIMAVIVAMRLMRS